MHPFAAAAAAALPALLLLTGCAGPSADTTYFGNQFGAQTQLPTEVVDDVSYWHGGDGAPSITINLTEQRAYFYKGGQLAGVALVATGKEGYDTPAGRYRVMEKIADKRSDLYGWIYDASGNVVNYDADIRTDNVPPGGRFEGADMPYWMRLTGGGIGMHQGVIPVPGSPASHGCIRVSKVVAATFFENARVGMPVRVVY
jgi:lipoprotein-anchoring transpeptidase ErfK/SrfK